MSSVRGRARRARGAMRWRCGGTAPRCGVARCGVAPRGSFATLRTRPPPAPRRTAPQTAAIARALDAAAVVDVVYRMLHGADAAVRLETTAFDRPPDADVTSSALKLAEAVGADSDTPAWARELFSALLNNAAEGCCAPTVRAAREALASHLACRGRELRTAMAEHNVLLFDTCIA